MMIRTLTLAALVLTAMAAVPAAAHKAKKNNIELKHPWVRAVPKGATVTAGYAKITNTGKEADRLTAASLQGAASAELHMTIEEAGIAKMRPVQGGIEIPAGATVKLETGGAHIMFLELTKPLEDETYVPGSLTFEKAGKIEMDFFVEPVSGGADATAPGAGHH